MLAEQQRENIAAVPSMPSPGSGDPVAQSPLVRTRSTPGLDGLWLQQSGNRSVTENLKGEHRQDAQTI